MQNYSLSKLWGNRTGLPHDSTQTFRWQSLKISKCPDFQSKTGCFV